MNNFKFHYKFEPDVLNTFSVIWVWKLKELDMNNFHYKFEPDVLNKFSVIWVWKLKILQRMYGLISAFATQKLTANCAQRTKTFSEFFFIFTRSLVFQV